MLGAVTLTVTMSVVLHGASAAPLGARYAAHASGLGAASPEHTDAGPMATRSLHRVSPPLTGRASGPDRAGHPEEPPPAAPGELNTGLWLRLQPDRHQRLGRIGRD